MKALAVILLLVTGVNAYADEAASDSPVALKIEAGSVIVSGETDPTVVGPGIYLNAPAAIVVTTGMKRTQAERDALAAVVDQDIKDRESKNTGTVLAVVLVGIVCLGGGVALGFALK